MIGRSTRTCAGALMSTQTLIPDLAQASARVRRRQTATQ